VVFTCFIIIGTSSKIQGSYCESRIVANVHTKNARSHHILFQNLYQLVHLETFTTSLTEK
jgi:hypothetical protein